MTSLPLTIKRTHDVAATAAVARQLAGACLAVAGAAILLAIITAEALYPVAYSTHGSEISDLGGTRPPEGLVFQPSAAIFDIAMVVVGLLLVVGAWSIHQAFGRRSVTLPIAVLGLSAFGVGVFPGNTGAPHALAAMATFISGGVAAVTSSRLAHGFFRLLFVVLGAITLLRSGRTCSSVSPSPSRHLGSAGSNAGSSTPS